MTEPTDLYRLYDVQRHASLRWHLLLGNRSDWSQHKADKPWFDQVARIEVEKFRLPGRCC
jgi:hypothetical protein